MKKSQFKIQQMAFMLMAITLFFILAGLFFLVMYNANIQKEFNLQEEERAINLVNKLSRTSEIGCGNDLNCIDSDKLMVLRQRNEYKDFWEIESFVVRKLYPIQEDVECTETTYPNCTTIKVFGNKNLAPISAYVSLCRKHQENGVFYNKCELGLLMVEVKNNTH